MSDEKKKPEANKAAAFMPIGMGLGIALGTAIGLALDNLALGLGVGVALGAGLGGGMTIAQGKKAKDAVKPDDEAKTGDH